MKRLSPSAQRHFICGVFAEGFEPHTVRDIYLGKLIASLAPGLLTVFVGFGLYSLLVNTIVGPEVGGWFFPTTQWWVLMLWVVPPFLGLTLSLVLRLSAKVKSTAAAQQASGLVSLPMIMIAYSQSTGALYTGMAVSWVIGRRGLFLNTVGDTTLVPKVFDAASRFESRPSDEEMAQVMSEERMTVLFA